MPIWHVSVWVIPQYSILGRAFQIAGYVLNGFLTLYIGTGSLNVDLPAIPYWVLFMAMIGFEQLVFPVLFPDYSFRALVVLQIVKTEGGLAEASPWIVSSLHRLSTQTGLSPRLSRRLCLTCFPNSVPARSSRAEILSLCSKKCVAQSAFSHSMDRRTAMPQRSCCTEILGKSHRWGRYRRSY